MSGAMVWASFLVPLAVFILAMHPAFQLGDSPEVVAACVNLGIQHFPGYPLMSLLGKAAAAISVGGVYLRINLLVAVLGAACCACVAGFVAGIFRTREGAIGGLLTGLALGSSSLFWEDALTAKGGIYLANLFLTLMILREVARDEAGREPRGAVRCRLALLFGLGLANHWMSIIWWAPLAIAAAWPKSGRQAMFIALFAVLGISLYLQLPFSVAGGPVWGDPRSAGGLLAIVSRRDFLQHSMGKPMALVATQIGHNVFFPFGENRALFVVAVAGFAALFAKRVRVLGFLLAGSALTILSVALVTNPVHRRTGELMLWANDQYLLPWIAACAAGFGAGVVLAVRSSPRGVRMAVWAVAAFVVARPWASSVRIADHSQDYAGFDCARNMVSAVPPGSFVLAEADYQSFPLLSVLCVERTPDFRLIFTNPHLERDWGWKRLAEELPEARDIAPRERVAGPQEDRILALVDKLVAEGRARHLLSCSYQSLKRRLRPNGLMCDIVGARDQSSWPDEASVSAVFRRLRLRGLFSGVPVRDGVSLSVLDLYGMARAVGAEQARARGDLPGAIEGWKHAVKYPGLYGRATLWKDLGLAYAIRGMHAEAENAFREAAAMLKTDLDVIVNIGIACYMQGNAGETRRCLDRLLSIAPASPQAAQLRRLLGASAN